MIKFTLIFIAVSAFAVCILISIAAIKGASMASRMEEEMEEEARLDPDGKYVWGKGWPL